MVDKALKYYDEKNLYPKSDYMREDHTKTKIWGIRLTKKEIDTWKEMKLSKRIHKILAGDDDSNDSIRLKQALQTYHNLFEMIIEKYGPDLDIEIQNYILNHNEFTGREI